MREILRSKIILGLLLIALSKFVCAGNAQTGAVDISSLTIVGTAAYAHVPGSLEVL